MKLCPNDTEKKNKNGKHIWTCDKRVRARGKERKREFLARPPDNASNIILQTPDAQWFVETREPHDRRLFLLLIGSSKKDVYRLQMNKA